MEGWVCRDEEGSADMAVLTLHACLKEGGQKRADPSLSPPTRPHFFPLHFEVVSAKPESLTWGGFPDSFHLAVGVRDSQGLGASTTLQVNIVNINDEIPRFTR